MTRISSNMGSIDKFIRLFFSVIIIGMFFNKEISGIEAVVLLFFAGVLIITSFIGFCPLYKFFGISTKKNKLVK
jgi:hypothetical protein